jgi:hypothetical protein
MYEAEFYLKYLTVKEVAWQSEYGFDLRYNCRLLQK